MAKLNHGTIEKNSILLLILTVIAVSIGGLIEIVPTFLIKSTIEDVKGIRPYSPLELAGRNIYIREGCYLCHSQMIRSLRSEVERYGHYSLAAESKYDHPFQWGSKRTGPDLSRVGGKYSDEWHRLHMANPRDLVPESVMPGYPFLEKTALDYRHIENNLRALVITGVPYTADDVKNAKADLEVQANPDADTSGVETRYPKAVIRDFDGNPKKISELDALVAYLQMLGTLVDFNAHDSANFNQ